MRNKSHQSRSWSIYTRNHSV